MILVRFSLNNKAVHYWYQLLLKFIIKAPLLIMLMVMQGFLSLALADYNNQNPTLPNNSNNGLTTLIDQKTTEANRVFNDVNYKKLGDGNKNDFFGNGGLGHDDTDQKKEFRIPDKKLAN